MCFLPLLLFVTWLLFLTELWQRAGEGVTPMSWGQPAVWRVGRDVKTEAWGWQQTFPQGTPNAGCSRALSGSLNSTRHLHPVLAFTFVCTNLSRKLGLKLESPLSLKEDRLQVLERPKWKIEIQLWPPECPNSGKYLEGAISFQLR